MIAGVDPALYPFTTRRLELASGIGMHYVDAGDPAAAPVVMVHGNPTWSFYYRELIGALQGEFRCLAPDHVGMGLSDRPSEDCYRYTLASRVADFGEWMDAVEPERAVDLVVHDWGGAIGLSWAVHHPDRVRRVVILNTWAFTIPEDMRLPRALRLARTALGAFLIQRFNAFSGLAVRMASTRRLSPGAVRGLTAPYRGAPGRRLATLRFVQDIPLGTGDPAREVLAETERRLAVLGGKPVLIGWGGRDFVFDRRVLARWRELLPEARVELVDDAGYYVLEDAADRLVPAIRGFLAG